MITKDRVGKGVVYLYIEAITMMFSGYLYWFILSTITLPSTIGTASTVISLVTIFAVISSVGVSNGIQRFIGKCIIDNDNKNAQKYFNSSLIIVGIGIFGSISVMLFLRDWIYHSFQINFDLLVVSIIMVTVTALSVPLRAMIIPSLNTRAISIASLLSTILKISVTILLISLNFGVLGILIGFTLYQVSSAIIFLMSVKEIYYKKRESMINRIQTVSLAYSLQQIFVSSIGFWIPAVINMIGSQLGTIFVFILNGASSAGVYFIAFSIVTGISVIISVLSSIAYPTISSMKDGRKQAIWRLIKISLIITLPISNILIFYSEQIMSLFGSEYTTGSNSLKLLLTSTLPTSIIAGVGVLVYAYGNNRQVLIIGLFTSIPRVLLYLVFVPIFGADGAAFTYLVGTIVGVIASIIIANKTGLKIFWKQITLIFIVPVLLSILFMFAGVNFVISIIAIMIITYVIFVRLNIITIEDIQDISKILPARISKKTCNIFINFSSRLRKSQD
jgi:O-antigen/teichoic acid export membrane protein